MASRSSHRPDTGAYSWSAGSMSMWVMRAGAPGRASASGIPWPRLHQSLAVGEKPRRDASVVTKMTPVRGTSRNAENDGSPVPAGAGVATGADAATAAAAGAAAAAGPAAAAAGAAGVVGSVVTVAMRGGGLEDMIGEP